MSQRGGTTFSFSVLYVTERGLESLFQCGFLGNTPELQSSATYKTIKTANYWKIVI
jgi:hypothetical protein